MSKKTPTAILVISILFLIVGILGFLGHAAAVRDQGQIHYDHLWICLVQLLAVVGAVYMFRGHNWARYLVLGWMGFHVVISLHHPVSELVVHSVMFVALAYFLFSASARAYFRGA
ncbi:MAG TPA: hypothetical protein VHI52_14700 [Verrucomicrobiae bacterium]|nr:hypothetical protein [Verrucomicrobiae bacterium]